MTQPLILSGFGAGFGQRVAVVSAPKGLSDLYTGDRIWARRVAGSDGPTDQFWVEYWAESTSIEHGTAKLLPSEKPDLPFVLDEEILAGAMHPPVLIVDHEQIPLLAGTTEMLCGSVARNAFQFRGEGWKGSVELLVHARHPAIYAMATVQPLRVLPPWTTAFVQVYAEQCLPVQGTVPLQDCRCRISGALTAQVPVANPERDLARAAAQAAGSPGRLEIAPTLR